MKLTSVLLLMCISALALVLAGCAANGKVTDFNKQTTSVSKLHLPEAGDLNVLDGNAVREIPLKKIKTLRIQSDITTIHNRKLYGRAEIVFSNGDMIGSFKDRQAKVFVCVDHYLCGEAGDGEYRILLNDVSRLEIEN